MSKIIKNIGYIIIIIIIITVTYYITKNYTQKKAVENTIGNESLIIETTKTIIESDNAYQRVEIIQEVQEIQEIIDNLEFSSMTCDGIDEYEIILNDNEKYGIEIYQNECHITSREKGEAILNSVQTDSIMKILNKYFKIKD